MQRSSTTVAIRSNAGRGSRRQWPRTRSSPPSSLDVTNALNLMQEYPQKAMRPWKFVDPILCPLLQLILHDNVLRSYLQKQHESNELIQKARGSRMSRVATEPP